MWDWDVDSHIKNHWKKIDEAGASFLERRFNEWELLNMVIGQVKR